MDACLAHWRQRAGLCHEPRSEVQERVLCRRQTCSCAADNFDRGKLYTARLQHPGGCNAAPGALANLLQLAGDKLQIRVDTQPSELPITDPQLFRYHIVFMHGRNAFRLTPAERKQLKTYLERGGMLFADAICSSAQFTESFRREMSEIFPAAQLQRIPPDDPLFAHGVRRRGSVGGRAARTGPGRCRAAENAWCARESRCSKAFGWRIAGP